MSFFKWSKTAASNGSADPSCPAPEGMAPSAVNDSMRGMMAAAAKYRDDISGAIVTGGTSTAYTVASNQVFSALATDLNGQMLAFVPHATNANAVGVDITLNVDGLGAKPVRAQPGVALPDGSLILGTPYLVTYNHADAVFYLRGMTNPYQIPISAGMDYWGPTTPNSSFAFPIGQAISRTTYASLFSGNPWSIGTTYGVGNGSTTFNLPDKTGRVSAMKEAAASRLTATHFGGNSAVLGAVGGLESQTLTLGQLPTGITSNNTGIINLLVNSTQAFALGNTTTLSGGGAATVTGSVGQGVTSTGTLNASDVNVTSNNTSGQAHRTVQPTIICNYIMRII